MHEKMKITRTNKGARTALFFLVFGTFAYFTNPSHSALFNSNELVRFLTAKSIVLDHSLAIEKYSNTGVDMAWYEGHLYSGKAPGLSLIAAPFYALVTFVSSPIPPDGLAFYILRVLCVSLPSALFVLVLFSFLSRFDIPTSTNLTLGLGYALGTIVFAYSIMFLAHQPAAVLCFGTFLVLLAWRKRGEKCARLAVTAGLLGGFTLVFEYPVALLIGIVALYVFFPYRRIRQMLFFIAGLIPGFLTVFIYNRIAFGNPFSFPYAFEAIPVAKEVQSTGLFGVHLPSLYIFFMLLVSPFRGLFFISPFLLLAVPGFYHLYKTRKGPAAERLSATTGMSPARFFWLSFSAVIVYLLFNASYLAWSGGAAYGPRHLVPVIPFFLIPIAYLCSAFPRAYRWPLILSALYSIAFNLVAITGGPTAHESLRNPVGEASLLYFATGNIYTNLGTRCGLQGCYSLIPLALLWLLCGWIAFRTARSQTRKEDACPLTLCDRLLRAGICILGGCMIFLFVFHRSEESAYRYAVIGHGFDIKGDDQRAAVYFEKSLSLDPRNPLVLTDYSRLLLRTGDYEKALNVYARLLPLHPRDPHIGDRMHTLIRLKEIDGKLRAAPHDEVLLAEKQALMKRLGLTPPGNANE